MEATTYVSSGVNPIYSLTHSPTGDDGRLRIDYEYQTNLGDILDPRSFDFRLISATAEGLTFDLAKEGDVLNETACVGLKNATKQLIDNGADFIVGDCGFLVYWQVTVRNMAQAYAQAKYNRPCPVMMSSLVLALPLLVTIPSHGQIGVLTASEEMLQEMQKKLASIIDTHNTGRKRARSVPDAEGEDLSGTTLDLSNPRFKVAQPLSHASARAHPPPTQLSAPWPAGRRPPG
jgi:hypothetical protein